LGDGKIDGSDFGQIREAVSRDQMLELLLDSAILDSDGLTTYPFGLEMIQS
jgi:hypothetical protein